MEFDLNHIKDFVKQGDLTSVQKFFKSKTINAKVTCIAEDLVHIAASFGRSSIIDYFVSLDVPMDSQSVITGRLPLHEACLFGNPKLVSFFLRYSKNIEIVDHDGFTPVHVCALQGELECIKALAEAGASFERMDKSGLLPIHWAAKMNHPHILRYLAELKMDLEARCIQSKTPLHYAVYFGNLESAQCLIELGCSPEVTDDSNRLPVHYSAWRNHLEVLKYLVSLKASLNVLNDEKRSPAHLAASFGSLECLHWILEQGFDPDSVDASGNTLAHLSIEKEKPNCLSCAVQHGASLNIPNITKGETALEMIKKGCLKEIPQSGNILCPYCKEMNDKMLKEAKHPIPEVIKSLDIAAKTLFKSPIPPAEGNNRLRSSGLRSLTAASRWINRNAKSAKRCENRTSVNITTIADEKNSRADAPRK